LPNATSRYVDRMKAVIKPKGFSRTAARRRHRSP
jgi:hypothetical protein